MTTTKEEIRIEKLTAMFKRRLLDFPVLSRSDVKGMFRNYSDAELDLAVEQLLREGFITLATGRLGGVRYVRCLEVSNV